MGSVAEIQEGTLETVDALTGTPIPAAAVSFPHGGEDTESTKEVAEEEGQPPKRDLPESSVPAEASEPAKRLKLELRGRVCLDRSGTHISTTAYGYQSSD